jgi:hypothetical protein
MTTVDFSTVLFEALQLSGNDRHNISDETFAQFRDFANSRLRVVWEAYEWPEIMRLEQLTLNDVDGDVTSALPTEAGYIVGVWNGDPLKSTKVRNLPYRLFDYGSGVVLNFPSDPAEAWCEYRLRKPELTGDLYSNTVTYSPGAQVYFDSGSGTGTVVPVAGKPHVGNFYVCMSTTTPGENPNSTPLKWEKLEIPYSFSPYLAKGIAADWLHSEMQFEALQLAEANADRTLGNLIDTVVRGQKQVGRINMTRTY